jgi:hypothetical protein
MATPRELRAAIIENRAQLQAALHGAATKWELKPAAGDGEDAWCPRQVVEHMVGSEWYFTNFISQACGAPALDRPTLDVASPAAAAATVTRVGAYCDNVLRHVSDGDLAKTWELRQSGTQTVEQMMRTIDVHARDHLDQIRTAS